MTQTSRRVVDPGWRIVTGASDNADREVGVAAAAERFSRRDYADNNLYL
jgi:hypothetical protein